MEQKVRILVGILVLLTWLCTWQLTQAVLYSRNTLQHYPEWVLGKSLYPPSGSFGVAECAATRNLLAGNRLNLAAWHGCQEVLLNRLVEADEVRFRFALAPTAYLYLFLSKNRGGSEGLRLSRSPLLPSSVLAADPGGRFIRQHRVPVEVSSGWHSVRVWSEAGAWFLELDGSPRLALGALGSAPGAVGFAGGLADAWVDDVEIRQHGRILVSESFERRGLRLFGLFLTLQGLAWLLVVRLEGRSRGSLLAAILVQLVGLGLAFAFHQFDLHFWSRQYPWTGPMPNEREGAPPRLFLAFEQARVNLLEHGFDPLDPVAPREPVLEREFRTERLQEPWVPRVYRSEDPRPILFPDSPAGVQALARWQPPACRVLFLGTSQTWGVSALHARERLIPQLRERLLALGESDFWLINAARPGSYSRELVDRYEDYLQALEPSLVVVNLGANDSRHPKVLTRSLARLVRLNLGRIPTVFFLEANAADSVWLPHLTAGHQAMRGLAERAGLRCFDAQAFLASPQVFQSGLLWVDHVHPTSYGQERLADFMARAPAPLLRAPGVWNLSDQVSEDLGSPDSELVMVDGFYPIEGGPEANWVWTRGPLARLALALDPGPGPYLLRLWARRAPGVAEMLADVRLNQRSLGMAVWQTGSPEVIGIPVPAGLLRKGQNLLELKFGQVVELSPQDRRQSSLCLDRLELVPAAPPPVPPRS